MSDALSHGIDNGTPSRHCGNDVEHPKHLNAVLGESAPASFTDDGKVMMNARKVVYDGTYCDGVPPLGDFVELTVRVPLTDYLAMTDVPTHSDALNAILDEGLSTYIWDELTSTRTRVALRLRTKGEDRTYPLRPADNQMSMEVNE